MGNLKTTTIEAGFYTNIKKLIGRESIKDRYMLYNDIIFNEIKDISKTIIIINEVGNGGIITVKQEFTNKALRKLKDGNKDKNIEVLRKNINKYGIVKLSLLIEDKFKGYKI